MNSILIEGSEFLYLILLAIIISIGIPLALFIIGLVKYKKNKSQGKIILIIATIYSIVSFGVCGGFGF